MSIYIFNGAGKRLGAVICYERQSCFTIHELLRVSETYLACCLRFNNNTDVETTLLNILQVMKCFKRVISIT